MNIIVDAFGGDHAPLEVIKGAVRAVRELGVKVTLAGDEAVIRKCAEDNQISLGDMDILHALKAFDIHEEPTSILKEHKDSSMAVGMSALNDGKGDAFVSAGSSGALVVGSTFLVKRIKGIKRVALAPVMPTAKKPFILVDGGANNDCRPEMLEQFAIMGSAYMEKVMNTRKPRVKLLNVGAEETKGRELELETYKLLLQNTSVNFCGNVEARELPEGNADVVVADGFTGNVALKLYEGMGKFFANQLKYNIFAGTGKLAALMVMGRLKAMTKQLDYKSVGGALMLGASKPVIKAHGSSDATAFFNAIRQARDCVSGNMIAAITEAVCSRQKG
ncbi:MAG: phosphate acyltransferase PlsX [Ruminococcus sp.]|nr:phosphate acyltransferase PlsX [Ruminococcus sp.]